MIYKLRTSKETQDIFTKLGVSTGLQPFALSKIAIALSIKKGRLSESDFQGNNDGLELSRQTIFGDHDIIFKCLISNLEKRELRDSEYFPRMVKAHLDRGAKLLNNEARYGKNFYVNLCNLDKNI